MRHTTDIVLSTRDATIAKALANCAVAGVQAVCELFAFVGIDKLYRALDDRKTHVELQAMFQNSENAARYYGLYDALQCEYIRIEGLIEESLLDRS